MIGLGLGVAGYIADLPALGAIGGAAALAAGLAAATFATSEDAVTVATVVRELDAMRTQLNAINATLTEERQLHDLTRAELRARIVPEGGIGTFDTGPSASASTDDNTGVSVVVAGTHDQTDTQLLADPETSLFSEAYFRVALDARIASARRHLRPVAVALVQVAEGQATPDAPAAEATKVTSAIRQTLRDADTACRMSNGCFALILEDTPENGAVWTVERIRRNLTSRYGLHTMWAGVACYPAHAFSTDEILDQAAMALDAAREWKQDRIEVATAD